MKFFVLILKNMRRNLIRTTLTALAIICLTAIFSMILSVILFLDRTTREQTADVAVVLTERYRIPSRFDRRYMEQIVSPGTSLNHELNQLPGFHNENYNVWHFCAFSLDPLMKDPEQGFFVIATLPDKIKSMIDSLEELDPKACELMKKPPRSGIDNAGILMGPDRLAKINKKVGDVFKARSLSHREGKSGARQPIELELEIVGALPAESRWAQGAFMDYAYLDRVLKDQKSEQDGQINLGWLKFDEQESANLGSGAIEREIRDIKSEIASAAVGRFLEGYKDLLNGVKFVLMPAITFVMTLIVANAISITVRERTSEMAVLKVLGFSPRQILTLVLGEGVLLGAFAGLLGAAIVYFAFNRLLGGIKIPFAFFPVFFVSLGAFVWGPLLGGATAFFGGIIPSWFARSVKVSEVFSKVA